jgi:hypothetical protein
MTLSLYFEDENSRILGLELLAGAFNNFIGKISLKYYWTHYLSEIFIETDWCLLINLWNKMKNPYMRGSFSELNPRTSDQWFKKPNSNIGFHIAFSLPKSKILKS